MGQLHALPRRSIALRFAPNKQTPTRRVRCDAKCHKLTCAVQQIAAYSVTFVAARKQRVPNCETKRLSSLKVEHQLNLGRLLRCHVA
jgi:hypothetical protein